MNKLLASIAASALALPALGAGEIDLGSVDTAVLGNIEADAVVVTNTALKQIVAGGDITVTESEGVITVAYTTPAAFDPTEINAHLTALDNATNNLQSVKVDKVEGKDLVETADYNNVKTRVAGLEAQTNTWNAAVQTVAKAADGAEELTVTQNGTAVTVDVNLSAYAKGADLTAAATRVATLEGRTNAWNTATATVTAKETTWDTAATTASANAALLADIAAVETDDISTLNECIAAIKAIVAAAQ